MCARRLLGSRLARPAAAASALASYAATTAAGLVRGSTPLLRAGLVCLACPLGALQLVAASLSLSVEAGSAALIAAALTLFAGRLFCGWLCPVGPLATEVVAVRKSHDWRLGAVMLASAAASSLLFRLPAFCLICPVGLPFKAVILALYGAHPAWAVILVLAPLLAVALISRRAAYWCGALCPVGVLLGLVGSSSLLRVRLNGRCTGCRACDRACPSGLHPASMSWRERVACTLCLRCLAACPLGSLSLVPHGKARAAELARRKLLWWGDHRI